jgi:hypothetical protein
VIRRIHHPWLPAIAMLLAATCLGARVGDVLYVARPTAPIRNGPYAFHPVVGWVNERDAVTVTGFQGSWLKVRCEIQVSADTQPTPVEGYIFGGALSAERPAPPPLGKDGKPVPPPDPVGALSAKVYCDAKGLGPDPFAQMMADSQEAMKNADARFEQFTRAGKVGPHKPASAAR